MDGNESLLDALRAWFYQHKEELDALGLDAALESAPLGREKSALWLTLDSGQYMGRITVWNSGEVEIECAEVATGEILQEHRELKSDVHIRLAADALVSWVSRGTRGG
jgi:hypothetical protein